MENLKKFEELEVSKQKELFNKIQDLKQIAIDNAIQDTDFTIQDKLRIIKEALVDYELGIYTQRYMKFKDEDVLNYITKYIGDFGVSEDIELELARLIKSKEEITEEQTEKWLEEQETFLQQFAQEEFFSQFEYLEELDSGEHDLFSEYFIEEAFFNSIESTLFYDEKEDKIYKLIELYK